MKRYYEGIEFEVERVPENTLGATCGFCKYFERCYKIVVEGKNLNWICSKLCDVSEYIVSYNTENKTILENIQRFCETQCIQDCEGCILSKYEKNNNRK